MNQAPNQKLANKLDLDLYRVLCRIEEAVARGGEHRKAWAEARFALSTARNHVRSMMSDDDRRATM